MKKLKIAALILTYNEEINITACIKSLHFVDQVFVFDSFSNDNSVLLAKEEGAEVFQRKFDNYASQRNEALKAIPEQFDWVLMIDADERITAKLEFEILDVLRNVESKILLSSHLQTLNCCQSANEPNAAVSFVNVSSILCNLAFTLLLNHLDSTC